jgi:altronate hydrolase
MPPSIFRSGLPAGWLRVHPADHVAVVLNEGFGVPPGHKVALTALKAGQRIVKYGWPIGVASQPIEAGAWVPTHNLSSGLTGDFSDPVPIPSPDLTPEDILPASSLAFSGYRRPDGRVGTRNELWVIPTVGCVNHLATHLAEYGKSQIASGRWSGLDGIQAWTHPYGCSQLGDDHVNTVRLLSALAVHPNAGAVLVVGLGCENNQVDDLKAHLGGFDTSRIRFMVAQEEQDEEERGRAILDELARFAGRDMRVSCPFADLVVGLKCGGSDAYSGLTANPLLGRFTDRLVRQGGSALLTEIPECFGAEQVLLARTPDPKVRQDFVRLSAISASTTPARAFLSVKTRRRATRPEASPAWRKNRWAVSRKPPGAAGVSYPLRRAAADPRADPAGGAGQRFSRGHRPGRGRRPADPVHDRARQPAGRPCPDAQDRFEQPPGPAEAALDRPGCRSCPKGR